MTAVTANDSNTPTRGAGRASLGRRDSHDGMTVGFPLFLSVCACACVTHSDCRHAVIGSGSRLTGKGLTCDSGAVIINPWAVINRHTGGRHG